METCKNCKFNEVSYPPCESCFDYDQYRKATNADRIRSMGDEQLGRFMEHFGIYPFDGDGTSWTEWLKREVE